MKHEATVSATGNTYLCDIVKPQKADNWLATVIATGTFGGTTLTFGVSVDGGSTVTPYSASTYTLSAVGAFSFTPFGDSSANSNPLQLYAIATGGSGINIGVTVLDNR